MHWLHRHRLLVLSLIAFFWTSLVVLAHFFPFFPVLSSIWSGESSFEDMLRREGRKTVTRPDFLFIGMDQQSIQLNAVSPEEIAQERGLQLMTEHPYPPPWSRELWVQFMDKLFGAGARLVIFDIVFSAPTDADPQFRAALDKYHDRVVIGCNYDVQHANELVLPSASLISPPQEKDDRVGFVNFWGDPDAIMRGARFHTAHGESPGETVYPGEEYTSSLVARAMEKLGHADAVPSDTRLYPIRFCADNAYQPLPLYQLFVPKLWQSNFHNGAAFKDKIIILGPSATILHDIVDTPIDPSLPGAVLHLHTLAAALDHEFLREMPLKWDFVLVVIAGVAAWAFVAFSRHPLVCFFALIGVAAAYLATVWTVYNRSGLFLMIVPAMTVFLPSGLCGLGFEYILERIEKTRTRRTLERYVSRNLVKEILENPGGYYSSMLGSRKPVTVLFSDLVGFTTLVEKSDPSVLVPRLNEYLSAMVPMVFDNGGTLDKFIGDAIMAVWGNVSSRGEAEDAKSAVRAALGMRKAMPKLNEAWQAKGLDPLAFGVGINHGDAVVGNIGSYEPNERLDPTVIGDAVNLASRLEGLTRTYAVDILIGRSATELAKDEFHFRSVARVQVKGKTEPTEVFTLIGARSDEIDPELLKWLQTYEEAIANFRKRDFKDAKTLLSHFLEFYPDDALGKMYLASALEFEQSPPDEAWNAVEVFKKK
ncbi:MAG TPA: adenylate/guanylate cyclase domain-containing protein [Chthoniobacterales bacterium]|nr:adenylate/guanylate cyclase domain-containing protein [Chthoniobacterales bacterium]